MNKAFTMIELIFIIVIIGILAAVALPKLVATRDDAEITKTAKNLSTIISDIGVYYVSQNRIAPNLKDMTNVSVLDGNGWTNNVMIAGGKRCIQITLKQEETATGKPIHLLLEDGTDANEPMCKKVLQAKNIVDIMSARFNFIDKRGNTQLSDKGEMPLGSSSIVKW